MLIKYKKYLYLKFKFAVDSLLIVTPNVEVLVVVYSVVRYFMPIPVLQSS